MKTVCICFFSLTILRLIEKTICIYFSSINILRLIENTICIYKKSKIKSTYKADADDVTNRVISNNKVTVLKAGTSGRY